MATEEDMKPPASENQDEIVPPQSTGDEEPKEVSQSHSEPIQEDVDLLSGEPTKKKKKNSSRGPTALTKNRGNGFEEYFADPPMTPEEALEEKTEIYSLDLSFEERMQNCIQRFRSRRRLQGDRTLYFNEYLFLGGVDCNPGSFSGLGRQDLKDLTPAQRREATARDVIYGNTAAGDRFYDGNKEFWVVDFTGVAAGYFSVGLPQVTAHSWEKMKNGIDTIENFFKYVLHHEACPEYKADVQAAVAVCEQARIEWPLIQRFLSLVPGQFNLAAAEIFCPGEDLETKWSFRDWKRPKNFDPKKVFYATFAVLEDHELFLKLNEREPKIVKEFTCSLQVTGINRPGETIQQHFASLMIGDNHARIPAVGTATFVRTTIEDEWDVPPMPCPVAGEITLYFDDTLLSLLQVGMKTTLTVCKLDVGIHFVKTLEALLPSFYQFLPQELMKHYKTPKENDRPAPSVNNPDAEDRQMEKDAQG